MIGHSLVTVRRRGDNVFSFRRFPVQRPGRAEHNEPVGAGFPVDLDHVGGCEGGADLGKVENGLHLPDRQKMKGLGPVRARNLPDLFVGITPENGRPDLPGKRRDRDIADIFPFPE